MLKIIIKLPIWKKILLLVLVGVVGTIGIFVSLFVIAIIADAPPTFFPLNNPQGSYKITKNCPAGQGWVEEFNGQGRAYCVEYKGPDVFMNVKNGNTDFFRITVGKSTVDLEPYVGKQVRINRGKYVSSSKQCIQDDCVDIQGPYVVLNINDITLVEEK
jgi:hypothetical protein